jgi:hypothetical protein
MLGLGGLASGGTALAAGERPPRESPVGVDYYDKLGVTTRSAATRAAIELKIV